MDFNWKGLLAAGATTLGTLVGGPLGPVIGSAVAGILNVDDPSDDAAMATALVNSTPEQRAALLKLDQDYKLEMERLQNEREKMQIDASVASDSNQTQLLLSDANSGDKFRSYARPSALWICVAGLALQCLLYPVVQWVLAVASPETHIPEPNMDILLTTLTGLLGLGVLRTVDKGRRVR